MSDRDTSHFLYLNREGGWPDFEHRGLELDDDGTLHLAFLPAALPPLSPDPQIPLPPGPPLPPHSPLPGEGGTGKIPLPPGPPLPPHTPRPGEGGTGARAGIAVGPDGTVWWSDGSRILALDPCDGSVAPVPCVGDGAADDATVPRSISGLLFHPRRPALVVADAENDRLLLFDPRSWQLVDVWGGPGRFDRPRSLAADSEGNLYVVDRDRVQKFDLRGDVVPGFWDTVQAEAGLSEPLAVAAAPLTPLAPLSDPRPARPTPPFRERGESEGSLSPLAPLSDPRPARPTPPDRERGESESRVFVVDAGSGAGDVRIVVLGADGHLLETLALPDFEDPTALLVHHGAIYLGDRQRLWKLKLDGTVIGEAAGYAGPVAGLALGASPTDPCAGAGSGPPLSREGGGGWERGARGERDLSGSPLSRQAAGRWERGARGERDLLWLHPGDGSLPRSFDLHGAYVRRGVLWGGPFGDGLPFHGPGLRAWHRLRALGDPQGNGDSAHFRFFVYASDSDTSPPPDPLVFPPPSPQGDVSSTFDESVWLAMPPDVPDVLVGAETRFLWIGTLLEGEGRESPQLAQMRLDYDHDSYAQHLPALFRDPSKGADPGMLERFLSLFESFFADVEDEIDGLDRLFDPAATPAAWLPWLAGWLALDLDGGWPEEKQRRAIADAFAAYAWRGTSRGLRAALRFRTGVDAHIEEPLARTAWWALSPEDENPSSATAGASVLGWTTVLVPAEAQGAVLGSTATLDASDLIRAEDFGAPLFEETAHRFSVEIHRSQVAAPGKLDEVRAVIEREKPAHTTYRICVIEPRFRVGWQARLGIDTVVADKTEHHPDDGLVLGGEPPAGLGDVRVGRTTRVTQSPVMTDRPTCTRADRPGSADRR